MLWIFNLWVLLPLATCIALHPNPRFLSLLCWRKPRLPYLLAFHDESVFSRTMNPVVRKVSKDTGLHIELFNVNDKEGSKIYSKISLLCNTNSVPLYYNLKSGYSIVGVTSYENLRTWALGQKPSKMCNVRLEELEEASYRVTGYWGRIQRIIRQIKRRRKDDQTLWNLESTIDLIGIVKKDSVLNC